MQPNNSSYRSGGSHKTRWIVITLFIIVILAINATWGWLYSSKKTDFHNQLNDVKQTAASQKNENEQLANELASSKQRLAQKDKQKPQSQSTTSEYREIPELGVKYKLTDQTKDLTYVYQIDSPKDGSVERISFSTVALTKVGAKEKLPNDFQNPCGSSARPAGNLSRYSPGQSAGTPGKPIEQVDSAVKVGDYYFLYRAPQAVCGQSKNDSIQQQAIAAAKEAVGSLQLIGQ